jgi:outer membrane biogenesis lipoprotein LolB
MTLSVCAHRAQRGDSRHAAQWIVVWLLIFVLSGLTAGCAINTAGPVAVGPNGAIYAEYFSLTGRLSVRQGDRLDTAKIEWLRERDLEVIRFYTPFGSQLAELTATAGSATLRRGEAIETAASTADLVARVLGVYVESSSLAGWLQGRGLEQPLRSAGNTAAVEWRVSGEQWQQGPRESRYAGRLTAISPGGDTSLRLVVDRFEPLPQAADSAGIKAAP